MVKKLIIALFCLVLVTAAGTVWAYLYLMAWADRPLTPAASEDRLVTLAPGQGLRQVAASLEQEGLITDALWFVLLARIDKKDKQLKAGEYVFSATLSPRKILEDMVQGRVRRYRVTIPEGYTLVQIAGAVGAAGLADPAQFLAVAQDPEVARKLGISAGALEGYLFPDTYYFQRGTAPFAIIRTMVKRFQAEFTPEQEARAADLGMTVHEVVTLASIVEKETGAPEERPIVASVFHNRLKKGMRLETDPTVIYGIPNFDGNIRRHHLSTYTPYNTYKIKGLPPGPIASPGALSLQAALYPAQTDYLYFVAKGDGSHQFSRTYPEHEKAVSIYQLKNRSR